MDEAVKECLRIAEMKNYRIRGKNIYKEIRIYDNLGTSLSSRMDEKRVGAWERIFTDQDFILINRTGECHPCPEELAGAAKKLQVLPKYEPQYGIYSFRNGVYRADSSEFVKLDELGRVPDLTACRFFDQDFPTHLLDHSFVDWYNIQTPTIQGILDFQLQEEEDAKRWLYMFLGSLLYGPGPHEKWGVRPFLKAVHGSRGSFIGSIAKELYNFDEVTALYEGTANARKKIADEAMMILYRNVNKNTRLVHSPLPTLYIGIEAPKIGGKDLITWEFPHVLESKDNNTFSMMCKEMPHLILKISLAYRWAVSKYAEVKIWDVPELPDYFRRIRKQQCPNPLGEFLEGPSIVVLGGEKSITLEEFGNQFGTWIHENRLDACVYREWLEKSTDPSLYKPYGIALEKGTLRGVGSENITLS